MHTVPSIILIRVYRTREGFNPANNYSHPIETITLDSADTPEPQGWVSGGVQHRTIREARIWAGGMAQGMSIAGAPYPKIRLAKELEDIKG